MYTTIKLTHESKDTVINETVSVLKKGGLVIFPSDTVYGLLVDATNQKAVEKLIAFKNRAPGKAISVFVADMKMLNETVVVKEKQIGMLNHLLPGPFTIVLESKHTVSKLLESEKGTLGVRLPDYEFVTELSKAYGKPITATSANLGGKSPHYSIESLLNQLPKAKQELIDLIIDAGQLPRNKPSTVVDLSAQEMKVLRHGDIVFTTEKSFKTTSGSQTQKLGTYIAEQYLLPSQTKPIVFVLQGDLGSGKTMLTKGIASYFSLEKIISPTFVVYYEYDIQKNNYKQFVHADLYNIEDPAEFKHLGLEQYLKQGNVMVIEWGEKLGDLYETFKQKATVIYISIIYKAQEEREIIIQK